MQADTHESEQQRLVDPASWILILDYKVIIEEKP